MWTKVASIRTSTFFACISGFALLAACAKGTEIDRNEIFILPVLPGQGPDASADAGAQSAAAATPVAPPAE